jgi:hypothetical protein
MHLGAGDKMSLSAYIRMANFTTTYKCAGGALECADIDFRLV